MLPDSGRRLGTLANRVPGDSDCWVTYVWMNYMVGLPVQAKWIRYEKHVPWMALHPAIAIVLSRLHTYVAGVFHLRYIRIR